MSKTVRYTDVALNYYTKNGYNFCDNIISLKPGYCFMSYFFTQSGASCIWDTIEFLHCRYGMSGDYFCFEIVEIRGNFLIAKPAKHNYKFYIDRGDEDLCRSQWETDSHMIRFTTDFKKHPILYTKKHMEILKEWNRFKENIMGR